MLLANDQYSKCLLHRRLDLPVDLMTAFRSHHRICLRSLFEKRVGPGKADLRGEARGEVVTRIAEFLISKLGTHAY
jgi:hypothetical protein